MSQVTTTIPFTNQVRDQWIVALSALAAAIGSASKPATARRPDESQIAVVISGR